MIIPLSTNVLLTVIVHDNLLLFCLLFDTLQNYKLHTNVTHNNFQDNTKFIHTKLLSNAVAHAGPPSLSMLHTGIEKLDDNITILY